MQPHTHPLWSQASGLYIVLAEMSAAGGLVDALVRERVRLSFNLWSLPSLHALSQLQTLHLAVKASHCVDWNDLAMPNFSSMMNKSSFKHQAPGPFADLRKACSSWRTPCSGKASSCMMYPNTDTANVL